MLWPGLEVEETLGERLLRLRTEQRLSLRQLAESCDVSATMVNRIEHGKRRPSPKTLEALARRLGVSPEVLEWGSDDIRTSARPRRDPGPDADSAG